MQRRNEITENSQPIPTLGMVRIRKIVENREVEPVKVILLHVSKLAVLLLYKMDITLCNYEVMESERAILEKDIC